MVEEERVIPKGEGEDGGVAGGGERWGAAGGEGKGGGAAAPPWLHPFRKWKNLSIKSKEICKCLILLE